jgi:hypothetical protein
LLNVFTEVNRSKLVYYVLPTLAVFLPLTALLIDGGVSVFSIAPLVSFLVVALFLVVPGIILAHCNETIRTLLLTVIIVFTVCALYFSEGIPIFSWIPLGMYGVLLLFSVIVFLFVWLLRKKLGKIMLVVLGVLWLALLFTPTNSENDIEVQHDGKPLNAALPRYIHIVLDGHIGIEGMSLDGNVDETVYSVELAKKFIKNGFNVYGRAYTQHNKSLYSFSTFLNFSEGEQPGLFIEEKKFGGTLTQNKLFKTLTEQGYRINLYQTNYIDMCDNKKYNFNKCENYKLDKLYDKALGTQNKIVVILNKLIWSYPLLGGVLYNLAKSSVGVSLGLPDFTILRGDTFSSESLNMLKQLEADVLQSQKGQAFFAHIMLPHHPYHFDSECKLTEVVPVKQGNAEYFAQLQCIQKKIGEFIARLDEKEMLSNSIVLIHGDHGSRELSPQPSLNSPPSKNHISWHSTFYAEHVPGENTSKYNIEPVSVSTLVGRIHGYKTSLLEGSNKYIYILPNGDIAHDYKFNRTLMPPFLRGKLVKSW